MRLGSAAAATTRKASGEPPKLSGGGFYWCRRTSRVYILAADDAWRMQGIPEPLLQRWSESTRRPVATGNLLRRAAGNAII